MINFHCVQRRTYSWLTYLNHINEWNRLRFIILSTVGKSDTKFWQNNTFVFHFALQTEFMITKNDNYQPNFIDG